MTRPIFTKTSAIGLALVAVLIAGGLVNFLASAEPHRRNDEARQAVPLGVVARVEANKTTAENLIAIAELAMKNAQSLTDLAASKGVNVSHAKSLIARGSNLLDDAKKLLTNNMTGRAMLRTRQAMEAFGRVDTVIANAFIHVETAKEMEASLQKVIAKTEEQIQKLRETVKNSNLSQSVKDEINAHLDTAQKHVDTAKEDLASTPPKVSDAAHELRDGHREIQAAIKILREHGIGKQSRNVEAILSAVEREIQKTGELLERAAKNGADVTKPQGKLDEAKKHAEDAKGKLGAGDRDGALEDAKKAHESVKEAHKELRGAMREHRKK
jgi:hypothetical protein